MMPSVTRFQASKWLTLASDWRIFNHVLETFQKQFS